MSGYFWSTLTSKLVPMKLTERNIEYQAIHYGQRFDFSETLLKFAWSCMKFI